MTGASPVLCAVKNASVDSPGRTTTCRCAGKKRHGIASATSALKVTTTSRVAAADAAASPGAACAAILSSTVVTRCVVPPKPVAWQNIRYSGTEAYVAPTMPTVSAAR